MKLSDFDYPLPDSLIAQEPVSPRDASRLLVVPRGGAAFRDIRFAALPGLLRAGDLLVVNDTRVLPARLVGVKESGGRCELLLVDEMEEGGDRWRALGQASKPMRRGSRLVFGDLAATVESEDGEGFFTVRFDLAGPALAAALERVGRMPLPPYIRRQPTVADRERYQTVMARVPGSAAAPTAGLHFTERLLAEIAGSGIEWTAVTLHVGPGTFLPVRTDDLSLHRMHEERYFVSDAAARAFEACRARGGRVVAVGTTAVRTLESAWGSGGLQAGSGRTSLFIQPGYSFRAVDALVTNLHLPRSTLLMLVCAFGGRERVLRAYAHAIKEGYRFFSYGDAMLVA